MDGAVDNLDRAYRLLESAAAKNKLREQGVDPRKNGLGAVADVREAVRIAPSDLRVVTVWGRLVVGMTRLSWAKRALAKTFAKLDIETEARALLPLLAAFPADPTALGLRQSLAAFLGVADSATLPRDEDR